MSDETTSSDQDKPQEPSQRPGTLEGLLELKKPELVKHCEAEGKDPEGTKRQLALRLLGVEGLDEPVSPPEPAPAPKPVPARAKALMAEAAEVEAQAQAAAREAKACEERKPELEKAAEEARLAIGRNKAAASAARGKHNQLANKAKALRVQADEVLRTS